MASLWSFRPASEARVAQGAWSAVGDIGQDGSGQGISKGIRVRIQFVSVQSETVDAISRLDAEIQLQVTRDVHAHAANLKTSRTLQIHGVSVGHSPMGDAGRDIDGRGKGCDDIVGVGIARDDQVGWEQDGVGNRHQPSAGNKGT